MLTPGRLAVRVAGSAVVLLLVTVAALLVNPRAPWDERAGEVSTRAALAAVLGGGDATSRTVLLRVRAPRIGLAVAVGAALAHAGALLQSLLRNPLADPFVLGVSSGAALFAVGGIALGVSLGSAGHPAVAAAGAVLTAAVVHALARDADGRLAPERLVLAGVVASYLLSAGVMWIVSLAPAQEGQRFLFWLMGSVASASGRDAALLGGVVAVAAAVALPTWPALNLIAVSEEHAADSGVAVERVKRLTFLVAAATTGAAVALAGSIGFVGLVVPHAVRLVAGSDLRLVGPLSLIWGGVFMVAADALSRAAGEVPVGVVTASLGAPAFLWLLARHRSA